MKRDPIDVYRARLLSQGVEASVLEQIGRDVAAAVDVATEVAKASPPPGEDLIMKDLWSDGSSTWRN
jgi:pyruvate dehydrogenase E1 component alpha subunit